MAEFERQGPRLISDIKNKKEKAPKDNTGWIVLVVILVIVVLVYGFIIYSVRQDANAPEVINNCDPGLCAFSIVTGIKRCPPDNNTKIRFGPGAEFCTSRNYCQERNYTCAVQSDQTLNCSGVCGTGNDECRCIQNPTAQ